MQNLEKKFLISLILFTIGVAGIAFLIAKTVSPVYITSSLPYLIVFFFSVTFFFQLIMIRKHKQDHTKFLQGFMLATMLKLMLLMAVMVVYVFINRAEAKVFIFTFFILYLFFTIFEVVSLNNLSKTPKENKD